MRQIAAAVFAIMLIVLLPVQAIADKKVVGYIDVSSAGDATLGGDPRGKSYSRFANLLKKDKNMLSGLKSIFKRDDLTIINLECTLTNATSHESGSNYIFKGKPAYAGILKRGGVDVVNIANNHIDDFKDKGMSDTVRAIRKNRMKVCGMGKFAIKTFKRKNVTVKVGVAGFAQSVSPSEVRSDINKLKKKCDIVIATFHWGTEWKYMPSATQKMLARTAINSGADLVTGHHSHVVSGVETYRGRNIAYGLGMLMSCVRLPDDTDAIIARQRFIVYSDGSIGIGKFQIVPITTTTSNSVNNCHPRILNGARKKAVLQKVKQLS
ncbi:MAG: CapA family protein [Clostridia bacterium]|nr:CapA family protein [Clostridia bacterium]